MTHKREKNRQTAIDEAVKVHGASESAGMKTRNGAADGMLDHNVPGLLMISDNNGHIPNFSMVGCDVGFVQ